MQVRKIKGIVNALSSQDRLIYNLEGCHHHITITRAEIVLSGLPMAYYLEADQATCSYCPDLPPPSERESKSATQLWKEAGEP